MIDAAMIQVLLPGLSMCLVLVGIHSYLGLHVIRRKVIFIDLALAQIAALGTLVAFLMGLEPGTYGAYGLSLLFCSVASAIFSFTRLRRSPVPQEAVIGLVYAMAAALAILLIDNAPHGSEHLKDIMTGHLLWVRWEDVLIAALVYSAVGMLHVVFHRPFIEISENAEAAWERGRRVRLWDFWFYLSFGMVITFSVNSAGVLIVFVFLIAPAILTQMLGGGWWFQTMIGWAVGAMVSLAGLTLSYLLDLPIGPAIIGCYGLTLITFFPLWAWWRHPLSPESA